MKPSTYFPQWDDADTLTKWSCIRMLQKCLLQQSDWTQLVDVSLSTESRQEWQEYRRQLREITSTYVDPSDVVFPDLPDAAISTDATVAEQIEAAELMIDLLLDTQEAI